MSLIEEESRHDQAKHAHCRTNGSHSDRQQVVQATIIARSQATIYATAQDEHERRVVDNTARLAQANEQLRHEIEERRYAEELLLRSTSASDFRSR